VKCRKRISANLDQSVIGDLIGRYFVHGYQASMWLLLAISLLAFGAVSFGLNKRTGATR